MTKKSPNKQPTNPSQQHHTHHVCEKDPDKQHTNTYKPRDVFVMGKTEGKVKTSLIERSVF
jgi:hypothetical protein